MLGLLGSLSGMLLAIGGAWALVTFVFQGTFVLATWPALGRGWFGIAIDQILVRGPWRVAEQHLGPDLGADHLPRRLHLQLLDND